MGKTGKTFMDNAYVTIVVPNPKREQAIRELSLKIFRRKLGFMFKEDVKDEVIDKLVASEPFQEYIQEATRQLDKRDVALTNNKMYPVIEIPADGNSGMAGGAYCLCFLYTKHKGNFVIKGYVREVEEYVKKNYTHYFYNLSLWYLGTHRDIWHFWKKDLNIYSPDKYKKGVKKENLRFRVRPRCDWRWDVSTEEYEKQQKDAEEKQLVFKRMPKRWIPEFENF